MLSPSLPKLSNAHTCTLVHDVKLLIYCNLVLSIGLEHFDHRLFSCHHWSVMLLPSEKRKSVILNIIKNIIVKHGISIQISNWWRLLIPCYAPERCTISLIHPRELEILFRNKQSVIWLQRVLHLSLAQQLSSIFLSMYWLLATFMSCKKRVWEPADVVVYHWSKPTLGRTWFEVEIKILFKSFIWRHCLFKQRPLLLYQMVSMVLYRR